jgi:thymidylate synthase ThyX
MDIKKIKKLFEIKKGEAPKTRFIDNIDAVGVELVDWPDPDRLKKVFVNMSQASWFENFFDEASQEDREEVVNDLFRGKILGQGMEHPQFCFLVKGLSLHGTHALVRNRIGIAYLQQSQAVKDFRHSDVLVPRAFTKNEKLLRRYEDWVQTGKKLYADMLDSGEIANTDARFCLPKTIPSWVYVTVSLPTLLSIYGKRTDSQEEHPEMNKMAFMMRDLVVEKFPYMAGYFVSHDDNGKCLHLKKGYAANCIFKRDGRHQIDGYEDEWTLHDKTKDELMMRAAPYEETIMIDGKRYRKSTKTWKPWEPVVRAEVEFGSDQYKLYQPSFDAWAYVKEVKAQGKKAYICGEPDANGELLYEIR